MKSKSNFLTFWKTSLMIPLAAAAFVCTPSLDAAVMIAGIDFDVSGTLGGVGPQLHTESGFLSVPATGALDYNVTHNGITFDIDATAASGNQNRLRTGANRGTDLTADFIQWFSANSDPTPPISASPPSVVFTIMGLQANTPYIISFYHYNAGSGAQNHEFFEGAIDPGNSLGVFSSSGNPATNPATWFPSADLSLTSDGSGEILVGMTGSGSSIERITLNGISVAVVPEPSSLGLLGLAGLALVLRRRK